MAATTSQNSFRRRLFRRGQTGQSLIILAIGFMALVGFVGIVTDVSLLFVRYSTLRRAVDAAAVAAAGQMRRVPADTQGEGQSESIANLNLAARQFIEVYGLNPSQVLAETCYTQNLPRLAVGAGNNRTWRPLDRNGNLLYTYASGAPNAPVTGDNGAANADDRFSYEQLCKDNEAKLVRVTAQIDSPTVFLSLLGFPTITLTESSISQTAVLDVVLIIDVSESMAFDTTYADWEEAGYPYRYIPPYVPREDRDTWDLMRSNSWVDLMTLTYPLVQDPRVGDTPPYTGQLVFGQVAVDGGTEPPFATAVMDLGVDDWGDPITRTMTGPTVQFLPQGVAAGTATRAECTVRVSPNSAYNTGNDMPPWLRAEYVAKFGETWLSERLRGGGNFQGFVPMYRSYACCNDPDGNWDFSDLVCQPFQQVRSATDEFLNNLDFIRGDRVAFVTFDVAAQVIDPDGAGPQRVMIEIEDTSDPQVSAPAGLEGARQVLNSRIGVRAESTYYRDSDNDGTWDGLVDYDPTSWDPSNPGSAWQGFLWDHFQTTPTGDIFVQPTTGSCFLDTAILQYPQVDESYHARFGGARAEWPLLAEAITSPSWFWDVNNPNVIDYWSPPERAQPELRSAEYRAGCGGGNIGGALNGAQSAFITDGRTEGAVWLMVLLSDGASGVTDPIARSFDPVTGDANLQFPNVFNYKDDVSPPYYDPLPGDYGAFGACPYGVDMTNRGEVLLEGVPGNPYAFPYCSDKQPESRHFCSAMPMPPSLFELDHGDCDEEWYDADDFARDWADWVALANLEVDSRASVTRSGSEQLPIIFTIGIGLDFSPFNSAGVRVCADDAWGCRISQTWSFENYLGEQLLRYIADAGDNGQIDDDFWQCRMGARLPNGVTDCGDMVNQPWQQRGPCEIPSAVKGTASWLDPQESCGNYFAAAETSDLERVFSIIASRMFTRLSQ